MTVLEREGMDPTLLKGIRAIELAQIQKLYAYQPPRRYFERLGDHLHTEFLGGSFAQKLRFLAYLPYTVLHRSGFFRASPAQRAATTKPRPVPSQVGPAEGEGRPYRVAISIMGSLGDFMHHVPLMHAFHTRFAPMHVDFFVHNLKLDDRSKLAVSGLPFIRQVLDIADLPDLIAAGSYELQIEIKHIVKYHVFNLPRTVEDKPGLVALVREADKRFEPYRFIFDLHPVFDGLFGKLMAERGMNAVDASGYFGNLAVTRDTPVAFAPPAEAEIVLDRHDLRGKAFITIHDGFEVDHAIASTGARATRSWPIDYWQRFVADFKARCPDVLVVQIGTSKTAGVIANVDVSLVDKASLPEACWAIKHARLHVDTEAGLVRVASATQTPSISIQGPSATEFFNFAHSTPIMSPFCRGCYWVEFDWMTRCLRGFSRAECMYAILPGTVAEAAARIVRGERAETAPHEAVSTLTEPPMPGAYETARPDGHREAGSQRPRPGAEPADASLAPREASFVEHKIRSC